MYNHTFASGPFSRWAGGGWWWLCCHRCTSESGRGRRPHLRLGAVQQVGGGDGWDGVGLRNVQLLERTKVW